MSRADNVVNLANSSTKEFPQHILQFSRTVTSIGNVLTTVCESEAAFVAGPITLKRVQANVRIDEKNVFGPPSDISFRIGSTIPFSFMTAYHSLVELAHLEKDQTILIHGASTTFGRTALTLA